MRHNRLDYITIHAKTFANNAAAGMAYKARTPVAFYFEGDKLPHFRCPPGTRRAGRWTDRLGTDCDLRWGDVARERIGEALERIGGNLRGDLPDRPVRPDLQRRLLARGGTRPIAPGEGRRAAAGRRIALDALADAIDPGGTTVGRGFRTWLQDRRDPTPEAPTRDRRALRTRMGQMLDRADDELKKRNRRGFRTWMDDMAARLDPQPDASEPRRRRGARTFLNDLADRVDEGVGRDASAERRVIRRTEPSARVSTGSGQAMATSADVAGSLATRPRRAPRDRSIPEPEQLQLLADRSDYSEVQALIARRDAARAEVERWDSAREYLLDVEQHGQGARRRSDWDQRRRSLRQAEVYTADDAEARRDRARVELRRIEGDLMRVLGDRGSMRVANSDQANAAARARLGGGDLQRFQENRRAIDALPFDQLTVKAQEYENALKALRAQIQQVRREMRDNNPADRQRLGEQMGELLKQEQDVRNLLQQAQTEIGRRQSPAALMYIVGNSDLTPEERLQQLLGFDPALGGRDHAIAQAQAEMAAFSAQRRQVGTDRAAMMRYWSASSMDDLEYRVIEHMNNEAPYDFDTPPEQYIDVYGANPDEMLVDIENYIDELRREDIIPQDLPEVRDRIAEAEQYAEEIRRTPRGPVGEMDTDMPVGGRVPRPNPPAVIDGLDRKIDSPWQGGLVPAAEVAPNERYANLSAAIKYLSEGGDPAHIPDETLIEALFLDGVHDPNEPDVVYSAKDILYSHVGGSANSKYGEWQNATTWENDRFEFELVKTEGDFGPWTRWDVFKVTDTQTGDEYFLKTSNFGPHDALIETMGYDAARLLGFQYDERFGAVRLGANIPDGRRKPVRWQLQPHVIGGQKPPLDDPDYWDVALNHGHWGGGFLGGGAPNFDNVHGGDVMRMVVLDYLTDNLDRNPSNWLVNPFGVPDGTERALPIDMGLAFGGRIGELESGVVSEPTPENWADFLRHRASMTPSFMASEWPPHGHTVFSYKWRPTDEHRAQADAAFEEMMKRLREVNIDQFFDPARVERRGAKLTDGERNHLEAMKQLFLTRLAILEELGPQSIYDAFWI